MGDKSDNMATDQDLLDILGGTSSSNEQSTPKTELEKAMEMSDEEKDKLEADKKMAELQEIATQLTSHTTGKNPGSGDVDKDLSNWFDGNDQLPSDELNNYVANASVKMDYGLTRNVLSSYSFMGKLRKFIEEDAFDVLFSEQALLGSDPDEVMDRLKVAFTMFKDLANLNAKINSDIKNYRLRSNTDSSDIDRLSLLLGSIPTEKLSKVLEEISYSSEKKD